MGDWKQRDVEGSREENDRRNEIGVRENKKTVHWGSARLGGPCAFSELFLTAPVLSLLRSGATGAVGES